MPDDFLYASPEGHHFLVVASALIAISAFDLVAHAYKGFFEPPA